MELKDLKQRFFALRNGLLADQMRRINGGAHATIFGLNLPQLMELAREAGTDSDLADRLWANTTCRESRLLAPMVCPRAALRTEWLAQVLTAEEADVLCHRLLRHQPGAAAAALALAQGSPSPLQRYAILRMLLNLMPATAAEATPLARLWADEPLTASVARQILYF